MARDEGRAPEERADGGDSSSVLRPSAFLTADRLSGAAIAAFGAWFMWQATELRQGPGYAAVGPRVFPLIVGLGILASGLALVLSRSREAHRPPPDTIDTAEETAVATDWPTLLAVAALLAAYVLLFKQLGFIITSGLFLAGGAWLLGSRSHLRDIVVGVLLSAAVYFVFTRLLGLELPAGPLEGPLRRL